MSATMSKRQQARNERALQDLIKTVPGNNVCADCQARNPGWASWSLGIFLCMRCAALHRKLGTHITKVKSLSMDSWSTEQVENMKKHGNIASNRIYNPTNSRPPIPIDADEADSAMERFIRQKYQDRTVQAREPMRHNNTGSTGGSDEPPPLPPKTGSRFGFRSASSIFPLSSKSKREAAANARHDFDQQESQQRRSPSPPPRKPSRIFRTTSVSNDTQNDLENKMTKLRDMGFRDEKRNMAVLKGLNGNLEKSIETLVRLGEGQAPTPVPKENGTFPTSRSRTPISPTAGISFGKAEDKAAPSKATSSPWEMLDAPPPPAKPQSSQSTGNMQPQSPMSGNNPYQQFTSSNPFGLMPSQSHVNLNQSFQNMAISPTSSQPQPLFPNHTGGFPGPQPTPQQQLYQQSMTPPVPSMPNQYYPPVIYENPTQQPQQNTSYNPFMQQQQQQFQLQQAPTLNTNFQSNPFLQQSLGGNQSVYNSPIENSPMSYRSPSALHSHQNMQQSNPFLQGNSQPQGQQQVQQQVQNQQAQQQQNYQAQQQQYYQQFPQQTHPVLPQQTLRADKRSIMDLYNHPQLAPAPVMESPQQQQQQQDLMQNQHQNMAAVNQNSEFQPQQQQQPMGLASPVGSRNPFMLSGPGNVQNPGGLASGGGDATGNLVSFAPAPVNGGPRHVSQESVSIDAGGWQNGRHSPDAWGTISGRVR